MKAFIAIVAVFAGGLFSGGVAHADERADRAVAITHLMSAREIEASGLGTLTQEQLDALSLWLEEYRCAIARLALAATSEDRMEEHAIESRIDGDFDGWVGNTVFRLENGQIWQQTSPSAKYLFAHAPKVVISLAPHTMKVEGIDVTITVRRLK